MMKLRYSATSPYARKVRLVILETGLENRVEMLPTDPWSAESDLPGDNPLGKVPTLITDDGQRLYDSRVVCAYLDYQHSGHKLYPVAGGPRWTALRRQALGDGILDAAVARRIETAMRPEALRWQWMIDRQKLAVERSLAVLEAEAQALGDLGTIGEIGVASALGYLDFRFAAEDWRAAHPRLAAWFARIAKRPSMIATAPP